MEKSKFKIDNSFALAISTFTNPFIVISLTFLITNFNLIFNNTDNFILFLVISIGLPLSFYLYEIGKHKKHLLHYISLEKKDRDVVYLITIFCLTFSAIFFSYMRTKFWTLNSILLDIFITLMYIVNKYIDKASMHAAGFCFAVMYLSDRVNPSFGILLIILPIIYWARIKLHKHTWIQLLLGSVIGMIGGLLSWAIR